MQKYTVIEVWARDKSGNVVRILTFMLKDKRILNMAKLCDECDLQLSDCFIKATPVINKKPLIDRFFDWLFNRHIE